MKTAFDTSWYVPETADIRKAELQAETDRLLAEIAPGHLYAVEFGNGVVKVGRSDEPRKRLATHAAHAMLVGGVISSWVSRRHYCCRETERCLIDLCARHGELVSGRECFRMPFRTAANLGALIVANRNTDIGEAAA